MTSFLLFLGVFAECGLIGEGLCCRLRDLGVLFVWVMYFQRSSWPIKSCGTFASRKASPNVSHPCGLKYFLLLPLTVSPLYFSSPFSLQAMLGSDFIFHTNSSALVFIVFGTLSNISSSIASFVSVSINACGDVDTLDTSGNRRGRSNIEWTIGRIAWDARLTLRLVPSLKQSREQRCYYRGNRC